MSTIIKSFFCFLILFSCNKYSEKTEQNLRLNAVPVLIKIGYYPSFHQPAETILNLKEKYLIFYNPTSYNPMPPPPPRKDGTSSPEAQKDYEDFLSERPELKPFKSNISQKEVERIFKLADSFKAEDFSDKNIPPALDGMSTNIIILYSDGNLVQINPMNVPNLKQRELYGEVLQILIEKNNNKNDSIILQKIKDYR